MNVIPLKNKQEQQVVPAIEVRLYQKNNYPSLSTCAALVQPCSPFVYQASGAFCFSSAFLDEMVIERLIIEKEADIIKHTHNNQRRS